MTAPFLCAICGMAAATTRDHIPPRSLYPKPRDSRINLNTVPACASCNNGSSKDDEALKVLIGIETGEHRPDRASVMDSLAGTIGNNVRLANDVFSAKYGFVAEMAGTVMHPAVKVTFDPTSYSRVISRIVRALHWMETGHVLATDSTVQVFPRSQLTESAAKGWMELMPSLPLRLLNNNTFAYRYHLGGEGWQLWAMQFFSRHTVFTVVRHKEPEPIEVKEPPG